MNTTNPTIEINGQQLEIPAGHAARELTGRDITRFAGGSDGTIAYEITDEGHRLVPPNEKVQPTPGARYGTMDRVVAGGLPQYQGRGFADDAPPVIELATVDGTTFEVPSGGALMLPNQIKAVAKADQKPVLYRITPNGHEVTLPDQPIRVQPGDRFGTMDRVVAGGRDHRRINAEIALLQRVYGAQSVEWTPDQQWVKLRSYALPAGYNQPATEMLIHVPETYGLGVPIRECYVDTGIRYYDRPRRNWVKIPHYFDADDSYRPREGVKQQGWGYFCLHCVQWGPRANFLTFLNSAYTVLSNPLHAWPTN